MILKFKSKFIFETDKMEIFGILWLVMAVVNCQFATNLNSAMEENQSRIQKRIFPLERILNKGLTNWCGKP